MRFSWFSAVFLLNQVILAIYVIKVLVPRLPGVGPKNPRATKVLQISIFLLLSAVLSLRPLKKIVPELFNQLSDELIIQIPYILMGFMAIWIGLNLPIDLYRFAEKIFFKISARKNKRKENSSAQFNSQRRDFFKKTIGTSTFVSSVAFAAEGHQSAKRAKVFPVPLHFPAASLPVRYRQKKIIQLSDLHIGGIIKQDWIERVIDQVLEEKPDLIVMTGDMLDGTIDQIGKEVLRLKRLHSAGAPVLYTVGNHEYYWGMEGWSKFFAEEVGAIVLNNRSWRWQLNNLEQEDDIYIVGVTDPAASRMGLKTGPDLDKACAGISEKNFRILLSHRPNLAKDLLRPNSQRIDLMLSGHTHGGQFFPFNLVVGLVQPYLKGHYQVGKTQLYVNQATGFWGPPQRFLLPREITAITLVS